MKILIVGDVHFSTYSSILRKRTEKFSERLENMIKCLNWAEEQADINLCDKIIYLGDFFDKPELNAEELTALQKVHWSNLPHVFIVGNHESPVASLKYNSTNVLKQQGFKIITDISTESFNGINLIYIPYTLEEDRKPIKEYLSELNISDTKSIIFSHNDIKGIQYGGYKSKSGFELSDIESNCKFFINGHLHNGEYLNNSKSILNLGNLTGQNFSEDASKYIHKIAILDTDINDIRFIENPYAFNFYKIIISRNEDLIKLHNLKNNSVLSIKCEEALLDSCKNELLNLPNVVEYKIIAFKETFKSDKNEEIKLNNIDHLKQFNEFILNTLGSFDVVKEELLHICGNIE